MKSTSGSLFPARGVSRGSPPLVCARRLSAACGVRRQRAVSCDRPASPQRFGRQHAACGGRTRVGTSSSSVFTCQHPGVSLGSRPCVLLSGGHLRQQSGGLLHTPVKTDTGLLLCKVALSNQPYGREWLLHEGMLLWGCCVLQCRAAALMAWFSTPLKCRPRCRCSVRAAKRSACRAAADEATRGT